MVYGSRSLTHLPCLNRIEFCLLAICISTDSRACNKYIKQNSQDLCSVRLPNSEFITQNINVYPTNLLKAPNDQKYASIPDIHHWCPLASSCSTMLFWLLSYFKPMSQRYSNFESVNRSNGGFEVWYHVCADAEPG